MLRLLCSALAWGSSHVMRTALSMWARRREVMYAAGAAAFIFYASSQIGPPGADAATLSPSISHLHRTLATFDRFGVLDARGHAAAQTYVYNGSGVVVGMHTMQRDEALDLSTSLGLTPEVVPAMELDTAAAGSHARSKVKPQTRVTSLNLGDSGAGLHAINSMRYAVPNTITTNTTPIATANGIVVPPHKCQARIPMRLDDGSVRNLRLDDAVILSDSAHNLISLGCLARDQHIATWIAPGEGASRLVFPDGSHAPLANIGVLVLPDAASDFAPAMSAVDDDRHP